MRKSMIIAIAITTAVLMFSCMKFEKIDYDKTGTPSIKNLPKQKMLLAGSRGTAENIAGDCIGSLYNVYFSLNIKDKVMAAPRARWPILPKTPAKEWVGIFGIPVPEEVNKLPVLKKKNPVEVKLGYWEYGEVAEIVHTGSYDSEDTTVEKLKQFVKEKGYVISGPHEEVYIKGPGMFGKGDTKKYLTLLRYQVKKTGVLPVEKQTKLMPKKQKK
jgi:hypothetical protein